MKILLINELYKMGGAEMQTIRETNLLRRNEHDVFRISCDAELPEGWQKDKKHYNFVPEDTSQTNWHWKRIRRFFVNRDLEKRFFEVVNSIRPDIIHINNMTYEPITIYKCLQRWPTVQTIRDFEIVCPNRLCVTPQFEACTGYCRNSCVIKCSMKQPKQQMLYFWLDKQYLKCVNRARLSSIKKFVCPSEFLSKACTDNGIPTSALNNSFDFSILDGFEKQKLEDKNIYLYYGLVASHKGIVQLLDAFEEFSVGKNVELHIVGKVTQNFTEQFQALISESTKIKYLGQMSYKNIIKYLENVYAVVVPSLWLENYPNTALEGLATRCIVLGSNRGGIPELIKDNRFMFDVMDRNSIIHSMEQADGLSKSEWKKITENNFNRVLDNNNLEKYYDRLIEIFEELLHK